ncbi:MAG: response regulator [bacterium]|nr:response regulator [bacterium]
MRILLVEDNLLVAHVGRKVLEDKGDVTLVGSGEEAIKSLQEGWTNQPFDLVFLDIGLPGISGPETLVELRRLEAEEARPKALVIMLTGSEDRELINRCFETGCDYYLVKPLSKEKVASSFSNLKLDPPQ